MIDSLRHGPAALGGQENTASTFGVQTLMVALRCWWKVALPLAILCAVAAGASAYVLLKPKYTATAWLIIRDRPFQSEGMHSEDPQKFIGTQIELIRSLYVLEPVAGNPAIASIPELISEPDRVQALRKQLQIKPVGRSDFFTIEFTSLDPKKATLVVNEVAQGYLKLHERTSSARSAEMITSLRNEQASLETLLETLRNNVESMTKQLTGKDLFAGGEKAAVVQMHDAVAELQGKLVGAEIEQRMIKVQLDVEKEALAKESFEPLSTEVERQVEASAAVQSLREAIFQQNMRAKELEKAIAVPSKNTAYQSLLQQVKSNEDRLHALRKELTSQLTTDLTRFAKGRREEEVAHLSRRLANSDFTAKVLKDRLESEMKGQKQYKGETLQLEFARADYERATKVHENIANQILVMERGRRGPAQVEIFKEAVVPGGPSGGSPWKKVFVLALAGLMLPFGCAVAVEHLRPRVTNSQQLETTGRVSVIGEITTLPSKHVAGHWFGRRPNKDLQLFEESINGLRTHLTLLSETGNLQVIVVTSAISGEGKTSLATQLAVSLASVTGEPTLLIDGDMRAPDIHRIFDVERENGLADVLMGATPVDSVIKSEFSANLHLITSGVLKSSPHRHLAGNTYGATIAHLRQLYRHIVIDTPPILCASEALLLARIADSAVVCVRRDYSRCDQTSEAVQRLTASGVKSINAVLTGVPSQMYAYKYGSYYYTHRVDPAHSDTANA